MAEAGFMQALMTAAMANPDVLLIGVAAGYILRWAQNSRKRNNQMGFP